MAHSSHHLPLRQFGFDPAAAPAEDHAVEQAGALVDSERPATRVLSPVVRRILLETLDTLSSGLWAGLAMAGVSGAALAAARRRVRPPITGILVVLAYTLMIRRRVELVLAIGLVLLLLPLLIDAGDSLVGRAVLALPGAAVIGFGTTPGPVILDAAVTMAIAVGGALAADTAEAHDQIGTGTLFLFLATVGGWLDIPDVDRILVLLGAAIPITLLVWPVPLARAGASAQVWVGALIWTAVDGGAIRLSSVVGTTTALGFLLIEPLVRRSLGWEEGVFARMWGADGPAAAVAPAAAQAAVVLLASRVAGLQRSTELSVVLAVAILAGAFFALRVVAARLDRGEVWLD